MAIDLPVCRRLDSPRHKLNQQADLAQNGCVVPVDSLGRQLIPLKHDDHDHIDLRLPEQARGRLGAVTQEEAEQWLARQTEERRKAREFGTRPERNFADAAEKYLIERAHKASIDIDALHISALLPFIGKRTLRQIHDATLESPSMTSAVGTGGQ